MHKYVLAILFVTAAALPAMAQPAPPAGGPVNPAAQPAPAQPAPPTMAPLPPPDPVACTLAEAPPPEDPKNPAPKYTSDYRQGCEKELAKDRAWWFQLEERLRARIHRQAAREITTNNRHVVMAYAAMWILAVGFVVLLWRRQQTLKAEIERLSRELKKAEG